jgi:hypothetical protein
MKIEKGGTKDISDFKSGARESERGGLKSVDWR